MKLNYKLIISICGVFFVAGLGTSMTVREISNWYDHIQKAAFNPPNWIFGPVWTLLYVLIGISLYLFWVKETSKQQSKVSGYIFFMLQLISNSLWSIIFFGMHNPFLGLIDICIMWVLILMTMVKFYPISKYSALLLLPYLLWVSFAGVLNLFVVLLNR